MTHPSGCSLVFLFISLDFTRAFGAFTERPEDPERTAKVHRFAFAVSSSEHTMMLAFLASPQNVFQSC